MHCISINSLRKPIQIGNRKVNDRLILSPMAGLGDIALRKLITSYGRHGLLYMEMCSARAIPRENRFNSSVFRWRDEELPYLVCQIFGSDPEDMAKAAKRIESEGFFGVDINLGCSVAAICKKNCGAALLKNPDLTLDIVRAVRKSVSIPLSVKYRTGWQDDPKPAVALAKQFESEGVDSIMFHPRVAPDRRSRPPRWEYIGYVKEAVHIPVFGNGNVFILDDVKQLLAVSGCDGIAIGRIAIAKPWIFSEWLGNQTYDHSVYKNCALKMLSLLERYYDPSQTVKRFKKFALYFASNFRFGHSIYSRLCKGDDVEEIRRNILEVFDTTPETTLRPNLNMFNS